MLIQFGYRDVEFPGKQLGELRASNELLNDMAALRERMDRDGYLLLRGLIDRDKVLQARRTVLEYMAKHQALTPDEPILEGVMPLGGKSVQLMGFKGISHHPHVLAVLESDELFTFFADYFGEPALTFKYKWLRGVGNEKYTGAHYDIVYMGRGSERLHTVWLPFADIPLEQGCLAMCVGSHNSPDFERLRQTYGRIDVDRDLLEGWFTKDPLEITEKFGGVWQTTNFYAGDIIFFGMYTMHASTTNTTNRFRLSCDIRFQPASDPVDKRWGGDHPIGYIAGKPGIPLRTMDDARAEWGI